MTNEHFGDLEAPDFSICNHLPTTGGNAQN